MFSFESSRSKAYSSDLRWRMVYQRTLLGQSYSQIASNLNVDPSTVFRTVKLFEETGTVCSIQGFHENTTKKLNAHEELTVIEAVVDNPAMYLGDLQQHILHTTGKDISTATICKFLQSQGFSHKKLSFVAQQRCDELRETYRQDVSVYDPEMLVFVDETGSDRRTCLRRYGYALKGRRAMSRKLLVRGKRYSAIGAMCMNGMLDVYITDTSVNGDVFCDFIERCLLPQMLPFDGYNPRSVLVMDNASIHHVDDVIGLVEEVGALVHFLPPYSPDMNPIEEAFSKVKGFLKANDPLVQVLGESEIPDIILSAFASITNNDCYGWVKHSGYLR